MRFMPRKAACTLLLQERETKAVVSNKEENSKIETVLNYKPIAGYRWDDSKLCQSDEKERRRRKIKQKRTREELILSISTK